MADILKMYIFCISVVFFDLRLDYAYVFFKFRLTIWLNYAYFRTFLRKFYHRYSECRPSEFNFSPFFPKVQHIWNYLLTNLLT